MNANWEFGGEFHWPFVKEAAADPILPAESVLFASGRDAFHALIAAGVKNRGWRRWFVPTYFCEEVAASIAATGIEVVRYEDSPLLPAPPPLAKSLKSGDAVLLVNYFGLRGAEAAEALDLGPADLIEDHTHDPWSRWASESLAHYCVASFRKTLPVPGGAALWSPQQLTLPDRLPSTRTRHDAVLMKLAAMTLKALYLEGHAIAKQSYRDLQLAGEERIASGGISGLDPLVEQMLLHLPWESWRRQRRANHAVLAKALQQIPGIEVLTPSDDDGSCPFSVVVMCATPDMRDSVRAGLIADAVYPAVLWPISANDCPELSEAARLAARMFTLACDYRYKADDLLQAAARVRAALLGLG